MLMRRTPGLFVCNSVDSPTATTNRQIVHVKAVSIKSSFCFKNVRLGLKILNRALEKSFKTCFLLNEDPKILTKLESQKNLKSLYLEVQKRV